MLFRIFFLAKAFDSLDINFELAPSDYALLILDVLAVALVGYWVNDWYDRGIDAINRPQRLLVQLSMPGAQFIVLLMVPLFSSFVITSWLAWHYDQLLAWWLLPSSLGMLYAYAKWLKRYKVVGNVLVSLMIAALPWLVVLAEWPAIAPVLDTNAGELNDVMRQIGVFSLLVLFANWSREIMKDLEDLSGDTQHGVKGLHSVLGIRGSTVVASLLLVGVLLVELWVVFESGQSMGGIVLGIMVVLLCVACIRLPLLSRANNKYSRASSGIKWLMLLGMLQLIFTY